MKESIQEKRRRLIEKAEKDVTKAYASTDHSIIQAINAYNELEKMKGIVYERLEEWYSIYFPEVRINNHETFSRFISKIRTRGDASDELLKELLGDSYTGTSNAMKNARTTNELDERQYAALKELAETELSIIQMQKNLDKFLEESVKKAMPNISYLIDYRIAAEMLSKAGSLERLATLPSSTIQLLGAEKALFKHLIFGGKPPKYGVLFKLPEFSNLNKKQKGRMARVYATKISIAARADGISKRFIADKLKEQLDKASKSRGKRQHNK